MWLNTTIDYKIGNIEIAQIDIRIYPMREDALPSGEAHDIEVWDINGHWAQVMEPQRTELLKLIQIQKPLFWDEVCAQAQTNALCRSRHSLRAS